MQNYSNHSNTPSTFVFPPSIQGDLFNYLTTEQQEQVKPILRVLKKEPQEELCCALMDYLETGDSVPPCDIALGGLFSYIVSQWSPLHSIQQSEVSEPLVLHDAPMPTGKGIFHKFINHFTH